MARGRANAAAPAHDAMDTLRLLQNGDSAKLMDLVDDLRTFQLGSLVDLPQLVVCGDQSAGKSAVLSAITQVPFPSNEGCCTRFATQIALRRAEKSSITARIMPDDELDEAEQEKLRTFKNAIKGLQDLGQLIEAATKHMGLSTAAGKTPAVSRNVLIIEIEGPTHVPLTLVDLPGWINSETKAQSEPDKIMIQRMMKSYLHQEGTIALAVISANNDLAVQTILHECQKVDRRPSYTRDCHQA